MLVRKFTATTSLGLGAVLLSFSVPAIANAAVDVGPDPIGAAASGTPILPTFTAPVPTDEPTTPEPTATGPVFTIPEPTIPEPTDPTDPSPTRPTVPVPSVTVPAPTAPGGNVSPVQPVKPKPTRSADKDKGKSDPGSDKSDEQGEKPADDPALGNPSDPGAVKPDSATAPQGANQAPQAAAALPNTGADANLKWMALAGISLIAFGGVLLKRPHLARHRA
jgi:LPXTG-motif cell wall-anchored protein